MRDPCHVNRLGNMVWGADLCRRFAAPLTEQQYTRLGSALEAHYGKPVTLQVVQDPSVMGGIRIQVGDEVVDGTVLRRLDEARRHVTGG